MDGGYDNYYCKTMELMNYILQPIKENDTLKSIYLEDLEGHMAQHDCKLTEDGGCISCQNYNQTMSLLK